MLCSTVVPLVADSPRVTAVMMALSHGCCKRAGKCWQRGHRLAESTWSLPSIACSWPQLNLMIAEDIEEDSVRTGVPPWPWSSHVMALCFSFSPTEFWSAMILWLRTQHQIDGFWLYQYRFCLPPFCLPKRSLFRDENEKGVHDNLGIHYPDIVVNKNKCNWH